MQLVAYGSQDVYLTGNPQITFFKTMYRRHTNFSSQVFETRFMGRPDFGSKVLLTVPRNGDLLHRQYLCVRLSGADPAIATDPDQKWAWIRNLGNHLIRNVDLKIGGQLVDSHSGEFLHMWQQLTTSKDHQKAYDRMLGNTEAVSVLAANHGDVELHIPLQFFFNRRASQALPMIALQYHAIELEVTFEKLSNLLVATSNIGVSGMSGLGITMKDAFVYTEMIFLDTEERRRFAQLAHEMLIETVQVVPALALPYKSTNVSLSFNHPVKEIFWGLRQGKHVDASLARFMWYHPYDMEAARVVATKRFALACARYSVPNTTLEVTAGNGMLVAHASLPAALATRFGQIKPAIVTGTSPLLDNVIILGELLTAEEVSTPVHKLLGQFYGSRPTAGAGSEAFDVIARMPDNYAITMDGKGNTIAKAKIVLNGQDRTELLGSVFFDTIVPMQHHTRVPDGDGINVFSFALHPEDIQPSGTLNMSRIDNSVLTLEAAETDDAAALTLVAVNYNVLRLLSGMGGLAYSS